MRFYDHIMIQSTGHKTIASLPFPQLFLAARMLAAESKATVPGTTFPSSLFNFLVEGYVKADLGVSRTDLPVLESLTRATRDALQNIDKFWRSKFPLQFQHPG
jgi:hypothetical protein